MTSSPGEKSNSEDTAVTAVLSELRRIAAALDRINPPKAPPPNFENAAAFVWEPEADSFRSVVQVQGVDLDLLRGVEQQKDTLLRNTQAFAYGRQANNVLLWGARGTGKSSLVKAVHRAVTAELPGTLILVELQREQLSTLPSMLNIIRRTAKRFIIFCDDLSFGAEEANYKSLKAVLDGGIEGRPKNAIFYATSNRRHLLSRDMIENERSTAINPGEAVEEKVSLSDRFGLWLGFHANGEEEYLDMVETYACFYNCLMDRDRLRREAIQWALGRGGRSGRVAVQFIHDLCNRIAAEKAQSDR